MMCIHCISDDPILQAEIRNVYVQVNATNVKLDCSVCSNPPITQYQWCYDSSSKGHSKTKHTANQVVTKQHASDSCESVSDKDISKNGPLLTFKKVKEHHLQSYICIVPSGHFNSWKTFRFTLIKGTSFLFNTLVFCVYVIRPVLLSLQYFRSAW